MYRLFLVLLYLVVPSATANSDKTVRFAIGEWAPYTSSTYQGVKVAEEVVIRAFATQGYEVKLDYHPWSRSLKLAAQTQYDGSFPWLPNKKRTLKYIYSKPFLRQKIVFFSHKSANFIWSDSTNFDNYVVGGTQDYHATNLLLELGISPIIDSSEESNFNKLAKNRIDLYPAGLSRGKYLINQLLSEEQLETIQVGSKPLIEGDMHIIFSRANTARSNKLKEVFAIGLRQLIDSGEYQAIVSVNNRINEKAPHSVQGFEINNSQ